MARPPPKKPSMRKAINDMCKSCIFDGSSEGTWRKQVEDCTSPNCPLYPLRPITHVTNDNRKKLEKLEAVQES